MFVTSTRINIKRQGEWIYYQLSSITFWPVVNRTCFTELLDKTTEAEKKKKSIWEYMLEWDSAYFHLWPKMQLHVSSSAVFSPLLINWFLAALYVISFQHPASLSKAVANNHDNFLNLTLVFSSNYYSRGDWRWIFRTNIEEKRKECLNFLEDKSCFELKRETVIKRTVTVVGRVKGFRKVGVADTA